MILLTTLMFIGAAADNQGWLEVQRGVDTNFELETTPLEIKTNSEIGSGDVVKVRFDTSQGDHAGGVWIRFSSPPQYRAMWCSSPDTNTNFQTNLPTATDKIWRITLTRTSGIRLLIQCNEVDVVNILLTDSACSESNWSTYWNRKVTMIYFYYSFDTATDFYRPYGGCMGLKNSWTNMEADKKFPVAKGTEVTLSCKAGYKLRGDTKVTCNEFQLKFSAEPQCVPCYKSGGMTTCETCAAGKEPNRDRTACVPCAAGSYKSEKMTTCENCAAGTEPNGDKKACVVCSVSYYKSEGMTTCKPCVAGKEPNSDKTDCVPCAAGSYKSEKMTTCETCAAGNEPNRDKTACVACSPGHYKSEGMTSCKPCVAGKEPNSDKTDCVPCASGRYKSDGMTTCETCAAGTEPNGDKAACVACSANHYKSEGMTKCKPCVVGTEPNSDKTDCVSCTGLKAEWKSTMETTTQFPVVPGTIVEVTCSESGALNKGSSAVTCVIGTEFSFTKEPSCSKPGYCIN